MTLENLLNNLSDDDRTNYTKAISDIGQAFAARTSITVDPTIIAGLPQVRDHVLSGGEYDLKIADAIAALENEPSISNQLIAAEVKQAEMAQISSDIVGMSRQQKMNYARERGLDRPRPDAVASMTPNEHAAVLAQLSPQQRMNYARRHGLS
jgi:hypothetical protein